MTHRKNNESRHLGMSLINLISDLQAGSTYIQLHLFFILSFILLYSYLISFIAS